MSNRTRADLRGSHLLPMCHNAQITTHEHGPDDEDKWCYGMYDRVTDELCDECRACGANVQNGGWAS